MGRNEDSNSLFENRDGGSARSLFLDSGATKGRSSAVTSMDQALSGFSPDFSSRLGSLDQRSIGENMTRSQSAAPSLDGRLSLGPPPGLENSQTPLVSNTLHDSYLESDRSQLFHLGQQRPASTGVIGASSSASPSALQSLGLGSGSKATVRPAAKTLMDLIQEDFPPVLPESLVGVLPADYGREAYLERPRTTSPRSQQTNNQSYVSPAELLVNSRRDGLSESFGRFQISQMDAYGGKVSK